MTDDKRPTWDEACNVLMSEHGPGTRVYEAARVLLDRVVECEAELNRVKLEALEPKVLTYKSSHLTPEQRERIRSEAQRMLFVVPIPCESHVPRCASCGEPLGEMGYCDVCDDDD